MKRILFSLLALVMTAMTASAVEPAYKITVGTNEHGTFAFKVNGTAKDLVNNELAVDAGDVITLTITPDEPYWGNTPSGRWYANEAMARGLRRDGGLTVPMVQDFELEHVSTDATSGVATYKFTMIHANAEISCTYDKLKLTVTANDMSIAYNDPVPEYTVSYTGFVKGHNASKLNGKLSFNCSYKKGSGVGTYTITPTGLTSDVYDITFVPGTLTVAKGLRTFYYETKEVEKTYGDANFTNNTLNRTDDVYYHTSNPSVANVDTETGEVKIRGVGTATITAILKATEYYYAISSNYILTVNPRVVENEDGTVVTQDQNGYSITITEDDDNSNAAVIDVSGKVVDLDYNRDLDAPENGEGKVTIDEEPANLYTLCLPFAPKTGEGVKYYTFSGYDGSTLNFTEVAKPAAYTPFVVAVTGSTDIKVSCENAKFDTNHAINSTTVDGFTFTGTLTGLGNAAVVAAAGEDNVAYILQNNSDWGKVVLGNTNVYIPPFRAYITGPDIAPNGARVLASTFEGSATGISSLRLIDADGTERWYDLNGRRIYKPTQKGVYIHNGKKVIVK